MASRSQAVMKKKGKKQQLQTQLLSLVQKPTTRFFYLDASKAFHKGTSPVVIKVPGKVVTTSQNPIAASISVDPTTLINGWSTKWQVTFREYLVVKVSATVRVQTSGSSSSILLACFWDEQSNTTPTLATASNADHMIVEQPSTQRGTGVTTWKPKDFLDAQWTLTSVPYGDVFFKVYDLNGVVSQSFLVEWQFTLAFRGFL